MIVNKLFEHNWSSTNCLKILIPTFNRINNLLKVLERLNASNSYNFGVIILDNLSPVNYIEYFDDFKKYKFGIQLFQNLNQIGPDENIIRVTELAENNDWIFLIGDSKLPAKNLITILNNEISKAINQQYSVLFSYDQQHKSSFKISSMEEFFQFRIKFGDLLLVGNSLMHKKLFSRYYSILYKFNYTRSVLPATHLMHLNNGGSLKVSAERVIEKPIPKPQSYNPGLSLLECWYSFPSLSLLPLNLKHKKKVNKMILDNEKFKDLINLIKFCLIKMFREKKDISQELYMIIKNRYNFKYSYEIFFIYPIFLISKFLK